MVALSEETVIPAPPDQVWPLLRDPEVVASCIPGAELAPATDDGLWRGSIKVKFGPTVAAFRGEAALTFDDETRTCTIEGRGIDGRGASRALASGKVVARGETETTLAIDGEFNVTGPLETFANAGGVHVARALLAEFSANLAKVVAANGGAPEPAAEDMPTAASPTAASPTVDAPTPTPPESQPQSQLKSPPRQSAAELNAFSLVWRMFTSALGRLVGKKG